MTDYAVPPLRRWLYDSDSGVGFVLLPLSHGFRRGFYGNAINGTKEKRDGEAGKRCLFLWRGARYTAAASKTFRDDEDSLLL